MPVLCRDARRQSRGQYQLDASSLLQRTTAITRTVLPSLVSFAATYASEFKDSVAFSQVTSDPRCNARQRIQDGGWRTRPDQSVRIVFKFDFGGRFRHTRTVLRPTSPAAPTHASSAKTSIRLGEQFRRTRTVLRPTSSAAPTHASSVNPILFLVATPTHASGLS